MFLPATKIRVIESTAGCGKTRLKKGSLLYVIKSGGLYTPTSSVFRGKFGKLVIVMPATVVVTRYGNELRRRIETKPVNFVFPFASGGPQDRTKCIKAILTDLKEYDHAMVNAWAMNKSGEPSGKVEYVVGYPTFEENNLCSSVDEISAWLYSILNHILWYYSRPLNTNIETRNRILDDISNMLPELKYKLIVDPHGRFSVEHLFDVRRIVDSVYDNKNLLNAIIKWGLSHKSLMERRLFYHNVEVFNNAVNIINKLNTSTIVPLPLMSKLAGWEEIVRRGNSIFKTISYTWLTASNNLPVNYLGDISTTIIPWVDYFKEVSK